MKRFHLINNKVSMILIFLTVIVLAYFAGAKTFPNWNSMLWWIVSILIILNILNWYRFKPSIKEYQELKKKTPPHRLKEEEKAFQRKLWKRNDKKTK
jgi:amino acid transporter